METTIKEKTMNNISSLQKEISNLELQIKTKRDEINKELSQFEDIVEELAAYIKLNKYPTDIYPVFSYESGVYDDYKDVELKIVYSQGYTDIVGLTREEFTRLKKLLEEQ